MWREKRGTTTAEAALVFPLVVLAVLAVVYILISLYTAAAIQSCVHIELRREAGTLSETIFTYGQAARYRPPDKFGDSAFSVRITVFEDNAITERRLYAQVVKQYGGRGGLLGAFRRTHDGDIEIIDEEDTIRQIDLIQFE